MTEVNKRGYQMIFTHESVIGTPPNDLYEILQTNTKASTLGLKRKVERYDVQEPDPAKVEEYKRLSKLLDEIYESDLWRLGYEEGYLDKPETKRIPVYAETFEEWKQRVDHAYAEAMSHRGIQGYPFGGHP